MNKADVYRITDRLDDASLEAIATRLEVRGLNGLDQVRREHALLGDSESGQQEHARSQRLHDCEPCTRRAIR